jgi:hypothetical protein
MLHHHRDDLPRQHGLLRLSRRHLQREDRPLDLLPPLGKELPGSFAFFAVLFGGLPAGDRDM